MTAMAVAAATIGLVATLAASMASTVRAPKVLATFNTTSSDGDRR